MATLSQIQSPVWTLSAKGSGAIAEGLNAVRQCIDIILRTTKGTDPLRPEFGSDVYKYQDRPLNIAIPNIKKAIIETIALWEKRVKVQSVEHVLLGAGHVQFNIIYELTDDKLIDILTFGLNGDTPYTDVLQKNLILQGYFPPNPSGFQYKLYVELNGNAILPIPPANGFADAYEMLQWVRTNWSSYGSWYLTADSLVGYINPQYRTGKIEISLLTKLRFQGGIPSLPISYHYTAEIVVDGVTYTNGSTLLYTAEQLRQWCQNHAVLGALGYWQIVSNPGSFNSSEFSEDFELYLQLLVVYTSNANSVVITIDVAS